MPQPNADKERAAVHPNRRRWIVLAATAVVIVAAVLLIVFLARDSTGPGSSAVSDTGAVTEVTSPYDFSELPADSGPAQVENASYVSILLADETGQVTAYGLNAGMPAAEALKQAVMRASAVDSDAMSPLSPATSSAPDDAALIGSTLTFVFPDRGKLTFDLYVEQGLVARGDKAWAVDGDLAALIAAAVAAGER